MDPTIRCAVSEHSTTELRVSRRSEESNVNTHLRLSIDVQFSAPTGAPSLPIGMIQSGGLFYIVYDCSKHLINFFTQENTFPLKV